MWVGISRKFSRGNGLRAACVEIGSMYIARNPLSGAHRTTFHVRPISDLFQFYIVSIQFIIIYYIHFVDRWSLTESQRNIYILILITTGH